MAYVTGTASTMEAVKAALVNACTNNGWSNGEDTEGKTVLYRVGGCYVRVVADGNKLQLLGRTSVNGGADDAPAIDQIYPICLIDISYPVYYFAFVFDNEVFFIINYGDNYLWCAFGHSQQQGLPDGATGNWVAASVQQYLPYGMSSCQNINLTPTSGGINPASYTNYTCCPALFLVSSIYISTQITRRQMVNWHFHHNFSVDDPWCNPFPQHPVGINSISQLVQAQPNTFSGSAILLPIRCYIIREDSKLSQVLELENARHVRIDNLAPKDEITLGADTWKVFPWFKKNLAARDGGTQVQHTGTFGWALRKS